MRVFIFLLAIFTCCSTVVVTAQRSALDSIVFSYQNWRNSSLQEKIFIHTDRSAYLTGETVWFKAYRVDAASHHAIDWSKIMYVELLDKNKLPVLQTKFLLDKNGADGSIYLPASLSSGNYVLRAYTNWMKNAGPAFFFHQTITVFNPFIPLEFLQDSVKVQGTYDAQFFPEGGDLVNTLESVVGVRVADKKGFGIQFRGAVLSDQKDTVAKFTSAAFGLSKFRFTPQSGQSYHVVIVDSKRKTFRYAMPSPKLTGYVMQVRDSTAGKIVITVKAKDVDGEIYLLGHTRQTLITQQRVILQGGMSEFVIDKAVLGPGISSFTIFDKSLQPVCERLYFKKPEQKLVVNLTGNPYLIKMREKVKLDFSLSSAAGNIPGSVFSLSVYKMDSLDLPVQNIGDYLWLTADLSGTLENPGYYFNNETEVLKNDIDNLMLTHGWRRFDWKGILKGKVENSFVPEIGGHLIFGRITEVASGKLADRVPVYLSFMSNAVNVYVSQSETGRLVFETEPITGYKSMIVQTPPDQTAGAYRIEISDPYVDQVSFSAAPFVFSRKQTRALEQRSIHMQVQNLFYESTPVGLTKPVMKTFYGTPDETYQLDDYTRFPTLEEVMREYVPGIRVKKHKDKFQLSNIDLVNKTAFSSDPLTLVDGVPVFDMNKLMEIDPLKLKQLDVVKRRYYLNAMSFDGIVSYTSYKGDLAGFQPPEQALLMNYKGLEEKREFFAPRYDQEKKELATQPDVRRVLYWSVGKLAGSGDHAVTEFFTSDVAGEYRIVVQALTHDGLPGYYTTTFVVK